MKRRDLKTKRYPTTAVADKPAVQPALTHIPPLKLFQERDDGVSLYVEKSRNNRVQWVKDEKVYTIRLGIHNQSADIGAFTRDTIAVCPIPTAISKRHRIMAFFTRKEKFPAAFMDDVILRSDVPVKLEYVKGSAALESNYTERRILLSDAVTFEDSMMITTDTLNESLPEHCTYTYDFISFQVRIVEERDYYIQKQVRALENDDAEWRDSVAAKIGDKLEFRVMFINNSDFAPEIIIKDELSGCLKFIGGETYTYGISEADDKIMEASEIITTGLKIEGCAPDTEIIVCYTVEVAGTPPADDDLAWAWSCIHVGSKVLEDYAAVIIE